MSGTFVVYIDESGDEGFRFDRGSSEWFVLSAVVVRKARELATVKLVDAIRAKLGKPEKKPLHFRDLKHEQRLPFVDEIARAELRTLGVLVHKPTIEEPEKFQDRYRLYFYVARYLLERVSWYCRDHKTSRDAGDGSAEIIFSNRSGMSYEELRNYLEKLRTQTSFLDIRIEWSVLRPDRVIALTPGKRMGLQIADAVASSFWYAVESSQHGFTEDRYVRMLRPIVYHREGRYLGHGLKLWPKDVETRVKSDEKLAWTAENYA